MSKVVFDIETAGDFNELDPETQEYLLKYAEDEKKEMDVKNKVGLWPLTSQVVAVAMMNPDTDKGKVFFQAPNMEMKDFSEDGVDYIVCSEKEILEGFWHTVRNYDQFITFNGRGMDCPYLMLRSAALKVEAEKNLMGPRFSADYHIDLLEQLTFYGATRKFSLDFYCRSLGIKSSKAGGMSGDKVSDYFKEKKYLDIARYCMEDVRATAELYRRWSQYLAF